MMKSHFRSRFALIITALAITPFTGCRNNQVLFKGINKPDEVQLASVDNNVCKSLSGRVVLYAIFVDTKETKPWSDYDIDSTIDSISTAISWLERKAHENKIPLNIDFVFHNNADKIPIALDLPKKTLSATLFQSNLTSGLKSVNAWADKIAVIAGKSLPPDTSKRIATKNTLTDKERLIARLRDIYMTENIALIYFINNYYKDELSAAFNTNSQFYIEYAVVSYKKPAVIAHEFLHLFGAWDLYVSPFDSKKKDQKRKEFAMREFPDEIMAFSYRNIESLAISPFTKYCIGWQNTLDQKYADMILGKNIQPIKY